MGNFVTRVKPLDACMRELQSLERVFNLAAIEACELEHAHRSRFAMLRSCEKLSRRAATELHAEYELAMKRCLDEMQACAPNGKLAALRDRRDRATSDCERSLEKRSRFAVLYGAQVLSENAKKELEREYHISQWVWKAQKLQTPRPRTVPYVVTM